MTTRDGYKEERTMRRLEGDPRQSQNVQRCSAVFYRGLDCRVEGKSRRNDRMACFFMHQGVIVRFWRAVVRDG